MSHIFYLIMANIKHICAYNHSFGVLSSGLSGSEFVSFFLIAGATLPMIYWIVVVKRMTLKSAVRTARTGFWVYDADKRRWKNLAFVAEVPGPEDKIAVRLVDDML